VLFVPLVPGPSFARVRSLLGTRPGCEAPHR